MAICKDVPVNVILRRTSGYPVCLIKKIVLAVIDDSPAITRKQAFLKRILCSMQTTVNIVKSSGRTHEVRLVIHSWSPECLYSCSLEFHLKIRCIERNFRHCICQNNIRSLDCNLFTALFYSKLRYIKVTVDESKGCTILEHTVFTPFHADELRCQDCETRIACNYESFLRCFRISCRLCHDCDRSEQGKK